MKGASSSQSYGSIGSRTMPIRVPKSSRATANSISSPRDPTHQSWPKWKEASTGTVPGYGGVTVTSPAISEDCILAPCVGAAHGDGGRRIARLVAKVGLCGASLLLVGATAIASAVWIACRSGRGMFHLPGIRADDSSWRRDTREDKGRPVMGANILVTGNTFRESPRSFASSVSALGAEVGEDPSATSPVTARLAFTAVNFYHVRDGKPALDYPWLRDVKLIEPHRETTLAVVEPRDGFEYRWQVRQGNYDTAGGPVTCEAVGAEVMIVVEKLEEHLITLEEVNTTSKVVTNRLDEVVMVLYVRREIRTLTDDEREELFDAMYTLWAVRVQGGNGKELYGEDYSDVWAINRLHFKGGIGGGECDHFHDGVGFLTSHALLTNTFEFSLQLVNPKLTLPYWDYTIESSSQEAKKYDINKPESRSPLLQSSWFGSTDPHDHTVKDGRWAFTKVPCLMDHNPGGLDTNPYSQLRAPWNLNNRPFLTRALGENCQYDMEEASAWPTCSAFYESIVSYDNFNKWAWNIQASPHGPVHLWLGGILDCDDLYNEIAALVGEFIAKELGLLTLYHRKDLFYAGIFKCKGHVEVDVPPSEVLESGFCGCLDYDLTKGDDYKIVMASLMDVKQYIGDFDEDTQRRVVALLCSGTISFGENSEVASSLDPTFWSIHPTLERLWDFAVLTGAVTDFTWPDTTVTFATPDGVSHTEALSDGGDSCIGHRGSDVFPFGLLEYDTDSFQIRSGIRKDAAAGGNTLTNREVLAAIDPRLNSLSYVYDTFKWKHCEMDGYDFDALWGERKSSPPAKSH